MTFSLELSHAPISDIVSDLARILSAPNGDEKNADPTRLLVIAMRRFDDGSVVWIAHDERESRGGSSAPDAAAAAEQINGCILESLPTRSLREARLVFDVSVRESGVAAHALSQRELDPDALQGFDVLPPDEYLPLGERRARRLLRSGRLADSPGHHIVYLTDRVVFDPSFSSQIPPELLKTPEAEPALWYPRPSAGVRLMVSDASMTSIGDAGRAIVGTAWVSSSGDWSVREAEIDRSRRRIEDINAAELVGIVEATRGAIERDGPSSTTSGQIVVLCDNTRAVQLARAIIDHDGTQFRYSSKGIDLDELLTPGDIEMLLLAQPIISWLPKSEGHPLHVAVDALTRLRASRASEIVHTHARAFWSVVEAAVATEQ